MGIPRERSKGRGSDSDNEGIMVEHGVVVGRYGYLSPVL